ncbi:MAG: LemA family protein [Candidatus Aenigmarchaeota archaeon]|nr:LemA family protein [Candidatus Aenigmarchaeota archaeon]
MALGLEVILIFVGALFLTGIAVYFISVYNGLVRLRNNIKKSWGNINVLLKQRSDELPKLISSVKGYMKHERETLSVLTKARTDFLKAKTMSEKAEADGLISGALKTIFAVAENYPNLKANENFKQLQERISGLENELADRREFYNDSVNNFNIRIESFPDMFVARMMSLKPQEMFKVSDGDTKDVDVKFD